MGRIEICGGIASGKTTLAKLGVAASLVGVFEDFSSNPFLRSFYSDPDRYAFETESSFVLQHYHQIKSTSSPDAGLICDFSFSLDLAYARVTLPCRQLVIFEAMMMEIVAEIGPPDVLIHLRCGADEELKRIIRRGRDYEQSVSVDYLSRINLQVESLIDETPIDRSLLVCVDSERLDFAYDERVRIDLAQTLAGLLPTRTSSDWRHADRALPIRD